MVDNRKYWRRNSKGKMLRFQFGVEMCLNVFMKYLSGDVEQVFGYTVQIQKKGLDWICKCVISMKVGYQYVGDIDSQEII